VNLYSCEYAEDPPYLVSGGEEVESFRTIPKHTTCEKKNGFLLIETFSKIKQWPPGVRSLVAFHVMQELLPPSDERGFFVFQSSPGKTSRSVSRIDTIVIFSKKLASPTGGR
jgi:hypothetical protein